MDLIAATRAEGGLVFTGINICLGVLLTDLDEPGKQEFHGTTDPKKSEQLHNSWHPFDIFSSLHVFLDRP